MNDDETLGELDIRIALIREDIRESRQQPIQVPRMRTATQIGSQSKMLSSQNSSRSVKSC